MLAPGGQDGELSTVIRRIHPQLAELEHVPACFHQDRFPRHGRVTIGVPRPQLLCVDRAVDRA